MDQDHAQDIHYLAKRGHTRSTLGTDLAGREIDDPPPIQPFGLMRPGIAPWRVAVRGRRASAALGLVGGDPLVGEFAGRGEEFVQPGVVQFCVGDQGAEEQRLELDDGRLVEIID